MKQLRGIVSALAFGITSIYAAVPLHGQTPPPRPSVAANFDTTDVMIPMRDGVRMHTTIYSPHGNTEALPIIFVRTPYSIERAGPQNYMHLVADGYIFAFQDNRGKYKSEGTFVMQRAPRQNRQDPKAIDEATDAYDSDDWLTKNLPHTNGKVGKLGGSYPGWLTTMALLDPHPALKAISPQASPADMWMGDDFHHQGAFRLSYGFEYAARMESDSKGQKNFAFDDPDTYAWYVKLGSLAHINEKYLHDKIPTWNDYVAHPDYDEFWQRQAVWHYLDKQKTVPIPTMDVGGWWDQEDFYGPQRIYKSLEAHDTQNRNFIVLGPWNHGGWANGKGSNLGAVEFGSNTSEYYRTNIEAPWFAHYLKDRPMAKPQPEAIVFQTGTNQWVNYDTWPPKRGVVQKKLYLGGDKGLSFSPPKPATGAAAYDTYVSDPKSPVPYRHAPIQATYAVGGSGWRTWLVEDQRFVAERPDVLVYSTPVLDEDITVTGQITAHMFAATSGTDSDWVVKLIDVYPDVDVAEPSMAGFQLMIANDVMRGRYRTSWEKPIAAVPNKPAEYAIDLHTNAHVFKKGHRIMVQVQSSLFPIIDMNPQKFVPNIFKARDSDFQKATQRIYHTGLHASYIQLPVETPVSDAAKRPVSVR